MQFLLYLSRFRIMDNTVGFYPTNMGSIPVGETKNILKYFKKTVDKQQDRLYNSYILSN